MASAQEMQKKGDMYGSHGLVAPTKVIKYFWRYKLNYHITARDILTWYINRLFKPQPSPQVSEKKFFTDLNTVWHPQGGKSRIILRWFMTEWCNYNCLYCLQNHRRYRRKGSFQVHCFDNYSPTEWIQALDRTFHTKEVAFAITGGEPMLDIQNMGKFLRLLVTRTYINNVRITTNMSWNPKSLEHLPHKEKMYFFLSYHPSQTRLEDFLHRVEQLKDLGFSIGIVNYVMAFENAPQYEELKDKFKDVNLFLHPMPLRYSRSNKYLKELFKKMFDDNDFYYLMGGTPKGKICYFPSIGYEMNQNGEVSVGCFPWISANIFKEEIPPLPEAPVKCPHSQCRCLDKYSFLKGFDRNTDLKMMKIYESILKKHLGMWIISKTN